MENPAERHSIYQELLGESFESLSKNFPKAHRPTLQKCYGTKITIFISIHIILTNFNKNHDVF